MAKAREIAIAKVVGNEYDDVRRRGTRGWLAVHRVLANQPADDQHRQQMRPVLHTSRLLFPDLKKTNTQ